MTTRTHSSYDFDDLMEGFVLFLKTQDEFRDYNFDGSGLRAILRVLAFNSQQQALQNNFMFNELSDTVTLRANAVSRAASIGYTPSSKIGATITADIVVTPSDIATAPATLTMTRDTRFFASKDNTAFNFSPVDDYTVSLADGVYTFLGVTLKQGIWTTNSFTVQSNNSVEAFVIPNQNVDTTTLMVAVKENDTSSAYTTFEQLQTAFDAGGEQAVYFLKENRDGYFQIEFGDGKIAKKLSYGNVVVVQYMVVDGEAGNQIGSLTPGGAVGGYFDVQIQVGESDYSSGGAEPETIESIIQMAPRYFASAGSAVGDNDYVTLTKKLYPAAADCIAWGGELAENPKYGYTYVAVKPRSGEALTGPQKQALYDVLKKHNIGSITPLIVDPQYIYLNVNTTVRYNPKQTILSSKAIERKVQDYLTLYSQQFLEFFGTQLDMSLLSQFINKIDKCVTGNSTTVSYERHFVPYLNLNSSYAFKFFHDVKPGSVLITGFRVPDANFAGAVYKIVDDGAGVLKLLKEQDGNTVTMVSNIGNVDYETGLVNISSFAPNSILQTYLTVAVESGSYDMSIKGVRDTILKINQRNVLLVDSTKVENN